MNDLTVFNRGGQLYTDSRDVAKMVGKDHRHLLRDIDGYVKVMAEKGKTKIGLSDFFVKSTYVSTQNKQLPCYLITKKGCEFVANKLTGEKGILFTALKKSSSGLKKMLAEGKKSLHTRERGLKSL